MKKSAVSDIGVNIEIPLKEEKLGKKSNKFVKFLYTWSYAK